MEFKLSAPARAMDLWKDTLAIGLKNGNIETLQIKAKAIPEVIMKTHHDGEVWGLTVVDHDDGKVRIITTADDGSILAYNASTHEILAKGKVFHGKAKKKKKSGYVGGASSMSRYPAEK